MNETFYFKTENSFDRKKLVKTAACIRIHWLLSITTMNSLCFWRDYLGSQEGTKYFQFWTCSNWQKSTNQLYHQKIMNSSNNTFLNLSQKNIPLNDKISEHIHETFLILTLSFLAFFLAPLTVAFNLLVIVPFCRYSRVRTASNQILLALAITDLLLGFVLFMASMTGFTKAIGLVEPHDHMHISYAVAMAMATLQVK